MKQGAKCPQCGETFSKLKDWGCPHCKTKLVLVATKVGQRTINQYVLKDPPKPVVVAESNPGFIFGSINAVKLEDKKWAVYVCLRVQKVVCPECSKAALWFPDITNGSLSHKCDCKAITEYYFRL